MVEEITGTIEGLGSNKGTLVGDTLTFYGTIKRYVGEAKNLVKVKLTAPEAFDTVGTTVKVGDAEAVAWSSLDTESNGYIEFNFEVKESDIGEDFDILTTWEGEDTQTFTIAYDSDAVLETMPAPEPIKGTIAATGGVVENDTVTFAGEIPRDADAEANVITLEITAPDDYDTQNTTIQKIGDELVLNWSELDPEDTGVVYLAYDVTEDNIGGSDDIKVTWGEGEEQTFYIIYSETMTLEPEDKPEPEEEENHITSTKQRQRPSEFPNIDHSRLTQEEYMLVIGNSTLKKWSDYKRWIRGYQSELDEINDNKNVSEDEKALCTSILNKHNAL